MPFLSSPSLNCIDFWTTICDRRRSLHEIRWNEFHGELRTVIAEPPWCVSPCWPYVLLQFARGGDLQPLGLKQRYPASFYGSWCVNAIMPTSQSGWIRWNIGTKTFFRACYYYYYYFFFLREIGKRLTTISDDQRETSFLLQRISVTLQRYNAIAFRYSFQEVFGLTDWGLKGSVVAVLK